nr:reverse transcriptase domain-containing protein [Tanacetum cinerariifolium]
MGREGPMIIEAKIEGHFVHRIYVDGGSTSEILYEHCFNRLRLEVKSQMILATAPLTGFSREIIWPMRQILLPVKIGDEEHFTFTWMNFVTVEVKAAFKEMKKLLAKRTTLTAPMEKEELIVYLAATREADPSGSEKPNDSGYRTPHWLQIISLECIMVSGPEARPFDIIQAAEERIKVANHPEQTILIGSTLTEEGRKALCDLLSETKVKMPGTRQKQSYTRGGGKTVGRHHNERSPLSQLVIKPKLEVYVDDLVIKSRTKHEIIRDMKEEFKTPREINIKLNPKKCTFEIEEGTFLGYKVKTKGIMTVEVKAAFKEMKKLIAKRTTLTAPMEKEELIVYLAATREAIQSRPKVAGKLQKWSIELEFTYALRCRFDATNNEAEYEALIDGLRIAEQMGVKNLQANVDSRLIANKVNRSYIAKELGMIQYIEKVKVLSGSFKKFSIKQVPRSENKKAHALSKIASTSFAHLTKQVLVDELKEKSINEAEVLAVMEEEGDTWMTLIYNYLMEETLTAKKEKARVHACRNKIRGSKGHIDRVLLANDARGCKKIDKGMSRLPGLPPHAKKPAEKINSHHVPVAILQMGNVIARPFPKGLGKVKFLIVAMDYFTKWIKAKHVATITELPHFLWAHRTIIKSSNGDTPFSLTYETEAVIPAEIGMPTLRTVEVDIVQNNEALEINLDLLEERREQVAIHEAKSKAKMEKYYNSKVRNISFKPGDLVYRSNEASHAKESGNLSPKWEGPYKVTEALGNKAYNLRNCNGNLLPRTWNVRNLK